MTFLESHILITPSASLQNVQFIFTQCLGDSRERHELVLEGEVEEGWGIWEMVVLLEILVTRVPLSAHLCQAQMHEKDGVD